MTNRNHRRSQPLADPHGIGDVFASGFEVHDGEDWLRLVCWVDAGEPGHGERRKVAAIVLPRSAVYALIQALRFSAGHMPAVAHN